MPSLIYVGPDPTDPRDVSAKLATDTHLDTGVSRGYVDGRVDILATTKATKVYTDAQDAAYVAPTYYTTQDALLIPLTAKGQPSGVASLDGTGKLPTAQTPVLGGGILLGPFGHTAAFDVTNATTIPQKFADFPTGVLGVACQLMVFMNVIATSTIGRPVIEVRYSTTGDATYAGQTLCAAGYGRASYSDAQSIIVKPVTAPGAMQDGVQVTIPSTASLKVTAWIFDDAGGQTTTLTGGAIASAAMFAARTTL
jgi:hypothetical protein